MIKIYKCKNINKINDNLDDILHILMYISSKNGSIYYLSVEELNYIEDLIFDIQDFLGVEK